MTKRKRYAISAAVLVACVCVALGVLAMLPDLLLASRRRIFVGLKTG